MKTEIFKDYEAFTRRTNKDVNGVTPEFAEANPDYEKDNSTNEGCWNCKGCKDCKDCKGCKDCKDCKGCKDCEVSQSSEGCGYCQRCCNCEGCSYIQNASQQNK